jgi:hypothetical protein
MELLTVVNVAMRSLCITARAEGARGAMRAPRQATQASLLWCFDTLSHGTAHRVVCVAALVAPLKEQSVSVPVRTLAQDRAPGSRSAEAGG